MGNRAEKNQAPTKRLGLWIGLFLLLSVLNWLLLGLIADRRAIASAQVILLVALFGVLLFLPSDARERERLIDTEAATATLGITFWTAMMWGVIAEGFGISQSIEPVTGALFIFLAYIVAKALVELRHR